MVIDKCLDLKSNEFILKDCVLYVHETDLEDNCDLLAAMTGATVFYNLVPFLTTHIICTKETVQLRTTLGRMYSETIAGSASNKNALTSDVSAVDLVTIEWLKNCYLH